MGFANQARYFQQSVRWFLVAMRAYSSQSSFLISFSQCLFLAISVQSPQAAPRGLPLAAARTALTMYRWRMSQPSQSWHLQMLIQTTVSLIHATNEIQLVEEDYSFSKALLEMSVIASRYCLGSPSPLHQWSIFLTD